MTAATAGTPLGLTLEKRQKWLIIATLMVAMSVTALSQQIIATAAPRIVADLGGFSLLSWVFTIFMLAGVIATPIAASLSDTYGRKPIMLIGMSVFLAASAAAALSVSMGMLIVSRALQGAGQGMVISGVLITIGDLFPPLERGRYLSLFIGATSTAQVAGPTLGGFLTDSVGWRACFLVGIPIGAPAMILIARYMPGAAASGKRRGSIDYVGAALLAVFASGFLLALSWGQDAYGWAGTPTLGLFSLAAVAILLFAMQERRHPNAIMPVPLVRNRDFVVATLIFSVSTSIGIGAATYLPTFIQAGMGSSATTSGVVTTPQAVFMFLGSFAGGQLLARSGRFRLQLIVGLILLLAGALLIRSVGPDQPLWHLSASVACMGLGGGMVTTTMSVVTMNAVDHSMIGVASGARQFMQQTVMVLAVAVFGTVLASNYESSFEDRLPSDVRAELPPTAVEEFRDATLVLDEARFAAIQTEVLARPGGQALLDETIEAQRGAAGSANAAIFLIAAGCAVAALAGTGFLRETPLRRSFDTPESPPAPGQQVLVAESQPPAP